MPERGRPDPKSLRLFVAIELPDDVRAALAATIDALKQAGAGDALRWVRPEGIHITLKFLGATDEEDLPAIITSLRVAAASHKPFSLEPADVGSFGGRRNLRVLWVGVGGETSPLASLAADVDVAMSRLHFARESRPFAAHLTLGRVRDETPPLERERIHDLVAKLVPPPIAPIAVRQIALMESTLQRGGAVYRALQTFPLEGRA